MRPGIFAPLAVGALAYLALVTLDALHIAEHSALRAPLVAGCGGALFYWLGRKIKRSGSTQR